jgi:hypothetical protein
MFVITDADAIRATFRQEAELSAAIELCRRFPGITDNTKAGPWARLLTLHYDRMILILCEGGRHALPWQRQPPDCFRLTAQHFACAVRERRPQGLRCAHRKAGFGT